MIRQVRQMLEGPGRRDRVVQVLVQPRKADLVAACRKHFADNRGKVAGLFYIGHGGASGRWELNTYEESFGWDDLVECGVMGLQQGLFLLDSCFSAVMAKHAIEGCKAHTAKGPTPAMAICAASNKPQWNYSVDWVLDVCTQHRVVVPGTLDLTTACEVVEDLKTGSEDYDPFYMFFAPANFAGGTLYTL